MNKWAKGSLAGCLGCLGLLAIIVLVPNIVTRAARKSETSTPARYAPTVPSVPVTTGGYVVCLTEAEFEDVLQFLLADDKRSVAALIAADRCVMLPAGVPVTITRRLGWGKIEFVVQGQPGVKLYGPREAVAGR